MKVKWGDNNIRLSTNYVKNRSNMKEKWGIGLCMALAMASCTGNGRLAGGGTDGETALQETQEDVNINGQWRIDSIVLGGSSSVRPGEENPDVCQYFVFTDSTYSIMTNCNSFYGTVAISGDSIALGDGMVTELACDNMVTEDALRKILPKIVAVDVVNDSVIRLNGSTPSEYIVLGKVKTEIK